MIYTKLTCRAMQIAFEAHIAQKDPSGVPYIFHPTHVAEQMTDEYSTCAALLHDVVEDTEITLADLRREFPPEVTDAVELLTHRDGEDYEQYLLRIRKNPIALAVKRADMAHNMDESRLCTGSVSPERIEKWREKYGFAWEIIRPRAEQLEGAEKS